MKIIIVFHNLCIRLLHF